VAALVEYRCGSRFSLSMWLRAECKWALERHNQWWKCSSTLQGRKVSLCMYFY